MLELIISNEQQIVNYYNLSHRAYLKGWEALAKVLMRRMLKACRCQIHYAAEIGAGFRVLHGNGIGIARGVRIGRNFHVSQNVTIGGNWHRRRTGRAFPLIGDNVWIMAGAVIAGPVTVGNNVIIGANTVISRDVPDNVVVTARSGRVVRPIRAEEVEEICGGGELKTRVRSGG